MHHELWGSIPRHRNVAVRLNRALPPSRLADRQNARTRAIALGTLGGARGCFSRWRSIAGPCRTALTRLRRKSLHPSGGDFGGPAAAMRGAFFVWLRPPASVKASRGQRAELPCTRRRMPASAEPPTTKPSTAPAPANPTSSVKKSSDFLGAWLVMDRRGRHEREPASHDAADATHLDVSLSNAAACPDLETRKSLVTSTNSDIFNIPQRATAVFDEVYHHGTLRDTSCLRAEGRVG